MMGRGVDVNFDGLYQGGVLLLQYSNLTVDLTTEFMLDYIGLHGLSKRGISNTTECLGALSILIFCF